MCREDPLEKKMAPHSNILAWKFHGQRSLAGCRPQGGKESDTTERLNSKNNKQHLIFSKTDPWCLWKL